MANSNFPPALAGLLSGLATQHFPPGSSLVVPGAVDEGLWWIETGLVRLYSLSATGVGRNHDFIESAQWAFASLTWNDGEPCCGEAALGLEALEATVARRLPLATLRQARANSPALAQWVADEMMRHGARRLQREASLLQASAEQRYLAWLAQHPQLAGRIAQHHVAAWLGSTPVGLSRIRARVRDRP